MPTSPPQPQPTPPPLPLQQDEPSLGSLARIVNYFTELLYNQVCNLTEWVMRKFDARREEMLRQHQRFVREIEQQRQVTLMEVGGAEKRLAVQLAKAEKLLRAATTLKTASEFTWCCMTSSGKAFCDICSKHYRSVSDKRLWRQSTFIRDHGGANMNGPQFERAVRDHETRQIHQLCLAIDKEQKRQPLIASAIGTQEWQAREAMKVLFKVLAHIALHQQPLTHYEKLIVLLDQCGGTFVGQREHSRKTAGKMADVATRVALSQLQQFLSTKQPRMNCKPHIGVAADKVSDRGGVQSQPTHIRFNHYGTPMTFHLAMPEMKGEYLEDSTGQKSTSECGGFQCWNKILDALLLIGIVLIQVFTRPDGSIACQSVLNSAGTQPHPPLAVLPPPMLLPCSHHHCCCNHTTGQHDQVSSWVFDGEAVYQGLQQGVAKYIRDRTVGLGDKIASIWHDPAHASELLKGDAMRAYPAIGRIHTVIKGVYALFSRSGA